MILADASILIAYLRYGEAEIEGVLFSGEVAFCGVTRAEILHGARSEADFEELLKILAPFDVVAIPEHLWDALGYNLYQLRMKGISVTFQDAVVATVALENDCPVWSLDKHYSMIQSALPRLKIFKIP